jgi:hypothetical protein
MKALKNHTYNIKGIISNGTNYTLRTPALIADALLGYGEALDCYAMKLQDEIVVTKHLENEKQDLENQKLTLILDTIKLIENPEARAEAMAKLFNPLIKTT